MAITGPELDLLQELLDEDPAADVYMDVARALSEQGDDRAAARVLRRAIEAGVDDPDAARRLARAASASGDHAGVKAAGDVLGEDAMLTEPELARAWALALDQAGELSRAATLAESLIASGEPDEVLQAVVDRGQAPPPDPALRARDPLTTVSRAEAYLEHGRRDLALRAFRQILAHHPDASSVHARLLQLHALPAADRPWVDDLSEEYWVNQAEPETLSMPAPRLVPQVAATPAPRATGAVPDPSSASVDGPPAPSELDDNAAVNVNGGPDSSRDEERTEVMRLPSDPIEAETPIQAGRQAMSPEAEAEAEATEVVRLPDDLVSGDLASGDQEPTEVLRMPLGPPAGRATVDDEERTHLMPRGAALGLLNAERGEPVGGEGPGELVEADQAEQADRSVRRRLPGVDSIRDALNADADADVEEGATQPVAPERAQAPTGSLSPEDAIAHARAIERRASRRREDPE